MKIAPLAKIAAAKKRLIEQTKEPSMKLRNAHWEQLRLYAAHCKDDGWYYGNKAQFQKRHDEIMRFLDKQCADSMSRPETPLSHPRPSRWRLIGSGMQHAAAHVARGPGDTGRPPRAAMEDE